MATTSQSGGSVGPIVCALAYAGGVIAYLPLLTLLLPLRMEAVAGEARLGWLTIAFVAGSVAAGAAGVLFGWLSDRSHRAGRGRRGWIGLGLGGTLLSYAAIAQGTTPASIVFGIVVFQFALNAILTPLMAVIAEEIADCRKGLMGGLIAGAAPIATLLGALLMTETRDWVAERLTVIGVMVTVCLLPLFFWRGVGGGRAPLGVTGQRRLATAAIARLLMQISGSVLFGYLLYYLETFPSAAAELTAARTGNLLLLGAIVPLPLSLLIGRWSDRRGHQVGILAIAAIVAAVGLAIMSRTSQWLGAAAGFCLYSAGSGTFLSLQTGFILRWLPDPCHRGRDLGIVNLSNTIPSLIGPQLTWMMATPRDFTVLLGLVVVLTLLVSIVTLDVRGGAASRFGAT